MAEPHVFDKKPAVLEVEAGASKYWCACGLSKGQPFCDGSHKGTAFTPVKWTAEESGRKFFCACKHTKNPVFCDGSHKAL